MILVNPQYEILECPKDALVKIERAARTCYKSEGKINQDSAKSLVKKLIARGHFPMIEFGGDIVVRFISNRGFSHELVRHRLCSFAQESTRFCNYSNQEKFDGQVSYIEPSTMKPRFKNANPETYAAYMDGLLCVFAYCEERYLGMIDAGVPPELAREALPIGLKTEINIKANLVEWRHIFKMRCSNKAHPRMRELMLALLADVHSRIPIIYDDQYEEFCHPASIANLSSL